MRPAQPGRTRSPPSRRRKTRPGRSEDHAGGEGSRAISPVARVWSARMTASQSAWQASPSTPIAAPARRHHPPQPFSAASANDLDAVEVPHEAIAPKRPHHIPPRRLVVAARVHRHAPSALGIPGLHRSLFAVGFGNQRRWRWPSPEVDRPNGKRGQSQRTGACPANGPQQAAAAANLISLPIRRSSLVQMPRERVPAPVPLCRNGIRAARPARPPEVEAGRRGRKRSACYSNQR